MVWARDYIIAATEKQPDAPAALNRLMKNQDDIGSAVGMSLLNQEPFESLRSLVVAGQRGAVGRAV